MELFVMKWVGNIPTAYSDGSGSARPCTLEVLGSNLVGIHF